MDGIMLQNGGRFHLWMESCSKMGDVSIRGWNHAPKWETFPSVDGITPQNGRRFLKV